MVEFWWSSWVPAVAPYALLLRHFIDGGLTADEFELIFLRLYKVDPTDWPADLFDVLDSLFADVDEYCADEDLRKELGGLDASQLRERAVSALERLAALAG